MALEMIDGEVMSRVDGTKKAVRVLRCSCGSMTFMNFWLQPEDDHHLECAACGETYCQGGKCNVQECEEQDLAKPVGVAKKPWKKGRE